MDIEKRTIYKLKGNIIVSNSKRINLYDLTKIMDNTFGNYNRTIYKLTWRIKNELNSFLKWEYRGREIDASIVSIIPSVKDNEPSITFNIVEYINKVVKPEQIIVKEGELHNYKFRKIFKTLRTREHVNGKVCFSDILYTENSLSSKSAKKLFRIMNKFIEDNYGLDFTWDQENDKNNTITSSDGFLSYKLDLRNIENPIIGFVDLDDAFTASLRIPHEGGELGVT